MSVLLELESDQLELVWDQLVQVLPYGDTEPLVPLPEGGFKVGDWDKTPERMRFEQVVDGKALKCVFSGVAYHRWFVE